MTEETQTFCQYVNAPHSSLRSVLQAISVPTCGQMFQDHAVCKKMKTMRHDGAMLKRVMKQHKAKAAKEAVTEVRVLNPPEIRLLILRPQQRKTF